MLIWGLSDAEIREAAAEAGVVLWDDTYGIAVARKGKALSVRLAVDRTAPRNEEGLLPFQARSRQGRRMPYVTWEGHREFMRIVFRDHPEARIKSAVADYRGREDFWAKHPATRGLWPNSNYMGGR